MEFRSERLLFRNFEPEDYPLFSSVFSNEPVMRYAYMNRITHEDEMRTYFNTVLKNTDAPERASYEFAVFNGAQFIGFADFHLIQIPPEHQIAEVGYFLLPEFWGCGYTTEIVRRFLAVLFDDMQVHKVFAACNANNGASERIMIKNGMTKEGTLRKERFKDGRWDDELRYGILREEWTCSNTHLR